MKARASRVEIKNQDSRRNAPAPLVDLTSVEKTSLTFCKIRDLFQRTTGLDFFLFFQNRPMDRWKEESFAGTIQLPRYCRIVRSDSLGLARCLSSHQEMTRCVIRCNRPICQRCHAGLMTIHFPVRVAGKGLGDIQTVCALQRGERARVTSALDERISDLQIPRKNLREAVGDLQIISKPKVYHIIDWLELIANYLAESSNSHQSHSREAKAETDILPSGCPSEEYRVRLEVGRSVPLPSWRAQRSTGGSATIVQRVIVFLDQYYYLPLSSQMIAQALGFEPSYFAKLFKQCARESPAEHLRRVRINQAQRLLRDPYLSILEVAERTGFADASYFTRVFHSALGMTPTQFRQLSHPSS